MKIISYSLFGFKRERYSNCFAFNDYLRGLTANIRLARVLFPDWIIRVHVDKLTHEGLFDFFEMLPIQVEVCEDAHLTKSMLWRLKPAFDKNVERFICRDLDSPLLPRDRQAVIDWENSGKASHAITDSVSHNIPMMGGMIGFVASEFRERLDCDSWEDLILNAEDSISRPYDFSIKGEDQVLLVEYIYPKFAHPTDESIKQHYVLGMPNTFLSGYSSSIPNLELPIDEKYSSELATLGGHIGSAGFYSSPLITFLIIHNSEFTDITEAEESLPEIFYWAVDIKKNTTNE
jgi:hypothetical protein